MKLLKIFIFIFIIINWINYSFAAIDMNISPIKYEIDTTTWSTITKTATITNDSNSVAEIIVWKSNFTSGKEEGKPEFYDELSPNQELKSWININDTKFTLKPNQKKEITFTIKVPKDATPGWHYWSIMFKNNNNTTNFNWNWSWVWTTVDYALLLLIKVDWNVISKWVIGDTKVTIKKPTFEVLFDIPFKNEWNTHIKPKWKIILKDENKKIIKWIWKEIVTNKNGAIIWNNVVDYIPINDIWWNILPNSKRNFEWEWKWFPYKAYDLDWNEIIKYWSPSDYYTKKNINDRWFLMFWEKVAERNVHTKINADIEMTYKDKDWKDIEFNSAKDFYIDYNEKYIAINPYIAGPLGLFIFLMFIFFIIYRKSKVKCINCKKKINKKMKICPYCETKQKTTE